MTRPPMQQSCCRGAERLLVISVLCRLTLAAARAGRLTASYGAGQSSDQGQRGEAGAALQAQAGNRFPYHCRAAAEGILFCIAQRLRK